MNVDLQRMQREFREDLNLRKNEELAIVLEQANKAIQAIAEEEKYRPDPAGSGLSQSEDRHHRHGDQVPCR